MYSLIFAVTRSIVSRNDSRLSCANASYYFKKSCFSYVSVDLVTMNLKTHSKLWNLYMNSSRSEKVLPLNFWGVNLFDCYSRNCSDEVRVILDIAIGSSTNPQDFPPLTDGLSLLHGAVIHCLPHGQIFTDPVCVGIHLPPALASRSAACKLSIYYSDTNVSEAPRWKKFIGPTCSAAGQVTFAENSNQPRLPNSAVVTVNEAELELVLHHFCIFAVVIDGREEKVQKASVEAFMKICDSSNWLAVDVLILIGCDEKEVVSTSHFIEATWSSS